MPISLRRRPSLRKRRRATFFGSSLAIFICLTLYYSHAWSVLTELRLVSGSPLTSISTNPLLEQQASFWRTFYHIILNNDPRCKKVPDIVIPEKLDIPFETNHIHHRPDVLWIDDADIQRLKIAHQNFLSDIQTSPINLVYESGTRGILTTSSEAQIPVLLIQLRMLRSTASLLPVEVFFYEPTPYIEHVCATMLASFYAKCLYYSAVFDEAGTVINIESSMFRILAILFSSFDEILVLDSDAWPISIPDHLFTYPPFIDTGLVLWPDFWYSSESPYFFNVARIENPPMMHTKPAMQLGQLMYAKSKHEISILLAAYYNFYGPDYYYPLLSQGAPGTGDKETFGSAALAMKEDFYWVKTIVTAIGRKDSSGRFLGSAMIQYDPIVDFQNRKPSHQVVRPAIDTPAEKPLAPATPNKPMFIHANIPTFDPRTVFDKHPIGDIQASPTRDTNETFVRCWDFTSESAIKQFGYDLEKRFWETIKDVACEDLLKLGDSSSKANDTQACHNVETYVRIVFGNSSTSTT